MKDCKETPQQRSRHAGQQPLPKKHFRDETRRLFVGYVAEYRH